MEIKQTTRGLSIQFPFVLKDAFKAAFPSARWNPEARHWEVSAQSETRLRQWVRETQAASERAQAQEALAMSEEELERLRREIQGILAQCKELEKLREEAQAVRHALEAARSDLQTAGAARQDAQAALQKERTQITTLLSASVDLDAIRVAQRIMAANMVPADRQKKAKFEEARSVVKHHRDTLRAAGWACAAINALAGANVNRPDRDHPRDIPEADWYRLWRVDADS